MGLISRVSSRTYRIFVPERMSDSENEVEREPIAEVPVFYCPISTMPYEYIEFMPKKIQEKCIANIKKNMAKLEKMGMNPSGWGLNLEDGGDIQEEGKSQKRGGKGNKASKQMEKALAAAEGDKGENANVKVGRSTRGKKKNITIVRGLDTCGVDLKKAAKKFGQKFACGSTVNGPGEIMIQGDVVDEVIDLIVEQFKISDDIIEDIGDIKLASDKKDKKEKEDGSAKDGEKPEKKSAGPRPQGNPRKK